MASGSYVAKDGKSWDELRAMGVRTVVGLEIAVNGVMDYADPNKDDRYKDFAARAFAEVLYALLDHLAELAQPAADDLTGTSGDGVDSGQRDAAERPRSTGRNHNTQHNHF
jgi:hypothetical protein